MRTTMYLQIEQGIQKYFEDWHCIEMVLKHMHTCHLAFMQPCNLVIMHYLVQGDDILSHCI